MTEAVQQLLANIDKADPDPADVAHLRERLALCPSVADKLGDLCTMASNHLLEKSFPSRSRREFITAKMDQMRAAMGYDDASEVERSLIQHVIMCWLRLYDCELRYGALMNTNYTNAQGHYWEKKLSSNQARYLRAVESLAKVRRLNLSINVNIAQQQIVNTQ